MSSENNLYQENIQSIKQIFFLYHELENNKSLLERLIATKGDVSEDTYNEYFVLYTNNIKDLENQIGVLEQKIATVKTYFDERKVEIENRVSSLEKLLDEIKVLYNSKAIDQEQYNKKNKENESLLIQLSLDNKTLHKEIMEFESIIKDRTDSKAYSNISKKSKNNKKHTTPGAASSENDRVLFGKRVKGGKKAQIPRRKYGI